MSSRKLAVVTMSVLGSACGADDEVFMQVIGAGIPTAQCTLAPDPANVRSQGVFDPRVTAEFSFTPIVLNGLNPTQSNPQQFFNEQNFFPEGNDIVMQGFDVCYIRGDDSRLTTFGAFSDGSPVDCESDGLPGEFVAAAGVIPPGGTTNAFFVPTLSPPVLQALFGADFDPAAIPAIGLVGGFFDSRPTPATENPRDPAWGDFPASDTASVFLIATAVGQTGSGRSVTSAPFTYEVLVSPGAFQNICGQLQSVACPDGTNALDGLIIDSANSCLPGSGFETECIAFNGCPPDAT